MFDDLLGSALTSVGIVVALVILALIAFKSRYKTVSPDRAMIVTGTFLGSKNVVNSSEGGNRKVKIVSGGGAFVLPIFQSYSFLSLLSHKIDVTTPAVYTEEGVPVSVDATAIIKIKGTMEDIFAAAERYLGKSEQVLREEANEVLEGHLRSILGGMTVEEIYKNRDKFAQEVQSVSGKDLKKMGLSIDSFTIKDVKDSNGYLDSLGKPRIAQVKRDAEIAEAEARKEATVSKARAEEQWKKAELERDIAVAEAEKNKDLRVAEFKKESDKAKAEANAAYGIQEAVSNQQVIEARMRAEQIQKEKDIELAEKEAIRQEKELDATVKKQADADLYRRSKEAEAKAVEIQTKAKADSESQKALAAARAEEQRLLAQADADAERVKGQAHADAEKAKAEAIQAVGLADADVKRSLAQVEVDREMGLAEAALQMGQLKVVELFAKVLPDIAGQIAAPMGNIDKVTIVDAGGTGDGIAKMSNSVTSIMHTLPTIIENMTGVKMSDVLKNVSGGRLSGDTFDPASFANIAKSLKGVDGNFAEALSMLLQDNPAIAHALIGGETSAVSESSEEAQVSADAEDASVGSEDEVK